MADYFHKDPDSQIDYTINWASRLGADTISGVPTWAFDPSGELAESSKSNTPTTATVVTTGGVAGKVYRVTNQIVTTGGLTMEEGVTVRVDEK